MTTPKSRKPVSPTYRSWLSMRTRCLNPNSPNYARYGGRGITICGRWEWFPAFAADMGERPPGTSLERIDTNGHYEPENCRWATAREQAENRTTNHRITIDGETKTLTAWARVAGVADTAMLYRVRRGLTGRQLLRAGRHGKTLDAAAEAAQRRRA